MNIFYTSHNPLKAARDHCVRHNVKMILEHLQMLSTAHHVLDGEQALQGLYKATHANHPSSVWARSSVSHYEWLLDCTGELLKLYTTRTGKIHKSQSVFELCQTLPKGIRDNDFTPPPVAAPDKFKAMAVFDKDKTPEAYKAYMHSKWEEWITRDKPLAVQFQIKQPEWLSIDLKEKIKIFNKSKNIPCVV